MGRFSAYNIYGAFCKILKNTENACKILKNWNIYTERQENSLEALLPSAETYSQSQHLTWGDITIDDRAIPSILQVHLKL
jgi:hypothetical protein